MIDTDDWQVTTNVTENVPLGEIKSRKINSCTCDLDRIFFNDFHYIDLVLRGL